MTSIVNGHDAKTHFSRLIDRAHAGEEIILAHTLVAGSLPGEHQDPFDRMIAAQAISNDLVVITRGPALAQLGCATFWAERCHRARTACADHDTR